jgi:hypothetical protein
MDPIDIALFDFEGTGDLGQGWFGIGRALSPEL